MAKTLIKKTHAKYHTKIAVGNIDVDPTVQRMYDPALAARLETNWDDRYIGTLVVSKRSDGSFFVIDGQHRKVVAQRKHGKGYLVDCEVHAGLSRRDEAIMFLRCNRDRKNTRPYDNFIVALTAGYKTEIRVQAEVQGRGLEVAGSPSANKIGAVQALIRIAEKDVRGGGLIDDTLYVLESAFGRTPETWDGMMLQAVGTIVNKNQGSVILSRLANTLRTRTVGQWKALAIAVAAGGGGSVSRSNRLVEIVVTSYNSRSRTAAKLVV